MISKNKTAATPMYQVIQELFLFFCKSLIKDFYFIEVGFITAINYIGVALLYCKLFTEQKEIKYQKLPTLHYLITYFLLLTTYYLQLTTYNLQLITYHLLLTTSYFFPGFASKLAINL